MNTLVSFCRPQCPLRGVSSHHCARRTLGQSPQLCLKPGSTHPEETQLTAVLGGIRTKIPIPSVPDTHLLYVAWLCLSELLLAAHPRCCWVCCFSFQPLSGGQAVKGNGWWRAGLEVGSHRGQCGWALGRLGCSSMD